MNREQIECLLRGVDFLISERLIMDPDVTFEQFQKTRDVIVDQITKTILEDEE